MSEFEKDAAYYKDSVQILGLSVNELEDFMNPMSSAQKHSLGTSGSKRGGDNYLMAKLQRIESIPDSLNADIEEIGDYCIKLISDLNSSTFE